MRAQPHNAPDGFDWLTALERWSLQDGRLSAEVRTSASGSAQAIFEAVTPRVWRISFFPNGGELPRPSRMMAERTPSIETIRVSEEESAITASGPRLTLRITRDPWSIAFLDHEGRTICRENPTDVDGLGRPFVLPPGFVSSEGRTVSAIESFHLAPDEHLFGLGEKFTPLDKRGQRIVSWTQDAFGSTSERSHKNIPFLWSTRGYGLLVDWTGRITWELGTVSCQTYTIRAEAPSFDAYILYGPSPEEILHLYADLTGHASVPPKWSFGLWVSSGGTYRDRPAVENLIEGLKTHDVPADVVHVDPWWMRWRHYCDFRWDESAFPRPQEFIEGIHARELRLCLWEHPYVSVESELFPIGKEKGYFIHRPDGEVYVVDYGLSLAPRPDGVVRRATRENSWNAPVAIIDLTNVEACAWFKDLHRPLLQMGVDVFKTDFGEDIPEDAIFHDTRRGATVHNLYPLLYNEAVFDVTREEHGEGIVWGRSGTSGSQRHPVCWSGDPASDFDSLACTIRGGLSAGLSGIPFWSNDIGGYRGTPTEELYIRWAQFGLLCSHSRMHGDSPREPWMFGAHALEIVRRWIRFRYQLFPYLYSTARESVSGLPVIRALPLVFPHDPNTYDKDLQYMLGPWILVAPVYDHTARRSVYIPEGTWFDFHRGDWLAGPRNIAVETPLELIPLYMRGGAIVPMMEDATRIPRGLIDPLILDVYPDGESSYRFMEEDAVTEFRCKSIERGILFEWQGGPLRRMVIRFNGVQRMAHSTLSLDDRPPGEVSPQHEKRGVFFPLPPNCRGTIKIDL